MTSYNLEIDETTDSLKCAKCKLVLKDSFEVQCGCRFCRVCIHDMIVSGVQFCPGVSEDCGESLLSLFSLNYSSKGSITRSTTKCANNMCMEECRLAYMEDQFREGDRTWIECHFSELRCKLNKLCAENIDGHLEQENCINSEILIEVTDNINTVIEMTKQRDEESKKEIKRLKQKDDESWKEIEILKQKDNDNKGKIEMMNHELALKDDQIRTITNRMIHVENENKSMAREKADLADRVKLLSEQIEREVDEIRENDELDMARVIDPADKEIVPITVPIGSNKDNIQLQDQSATSEVDEICSRKLQLQSAQTPGTICKVDARCDWLIDVDIGKSHWEWQVKKSPCFIGTVHRYKYQLESFNNIPTNRGLLRNSSISQTGSLSNIRIAQHSLGFRLRIYRDSSDNMQLVWPFKGQVVITVTDRDRRKVSRKLSRQCRINRPSANETCSRSDPFVFLHSELKEAGMNLFRGVKVTCEIFPGAGR